MYLFCNQWQNTQCSFKYFEQCIYLIFVCVTLFVSDIIFHKTLKNVVLSAIELSNQKLILMLY